MALRILKKILNRAFGLITPINSAIRRLTLHLEGVSVGTSSTISFKANVKRMYGGSIYIGSRCSVHEYALILSYGGSIRLGDDCSVNPFCILYGHGGLSIGNGVRIASHTVFIPSNHNFSDASKYIYEQGETSKGIIVEDDVWIGTRVTVLDGVVIRKGCVIAAGAVVTKSTEQYGIYAGVPAKKIGSRLENLGMELNNEY